MTGRSVLITGCSDGGLGAALALEFHNKGYRVIATARNVSKMALLKSKGIETAALDVLSADSIEQCVEETGKLLGGKLDMLVNNAGGGYSMPIMDIDIASLRNLYELNVFSVISVTQGFLPLLRKSSNAVIVNQTSVAGMLASGVPMQSAYNSSKSAASMITHNLRSELAPFGIKVVDLRTGAVKSNFFNNVGDPKLPAGSMYTPAKGAIEHFMKGTELMKNAITAEVWAQRVVKDLSKSSPPYDVYRGSKATVLWVASFLPPWLLLSQLKPIVGLTALEKELKAQNSGVKRA